MTLVHKRNMMKCTEGAFQHWGYEVAEQQFSAHTFTWRQYEQIKQTAGIETVNQAQAEAKADGKIIVKDTLADITLQQILTRPEQFDVIATLNVNGDYLSNALAA